MGGHKILLADFYEEVEQLWTTVWLVDHHSGDQGFVFGPKGKTLKAGIQSLNPSQLCSLQLMTGDCVLREQIRSQTQLW